MLNEKNKFQESRMEHIYIRKKEEKDPFVKGLTQVIGLDSSFLLLASLYLLIFL